MDENKEHTGGRDGRHKWTPIAVAVIGSIVGSGGTIGLVFNSPLGESLARPDPYTATQARTQAAALNKRIDHLEGELDVHRNQHPDRNNQYDRRIAALEATLPIILANQQRILDRLDKL